MRYNRNLRIMRNTIFHSDFRKSEVWNLPSLEGPTRIITFLYVSVLTQITLSTLL